MEKGMATHSSIPAWRIPWTEETGGLQSIGSQKTWTQLSNWKTHSPGQASGQSKQHALHCLKWLPMSLHCAREWFYQLVSNNAFLCPLTISLGWCNLNLCFNKIFSDIKYCSQHFLSWQRQRTPQGSWSHFILNIIYICVCVQHLDIIFILNI